MDDRLNSARSALLVVDVQERLLGAMDGGLRERHVSRMVALVGGCRALGLPLVCTEQYPRGLGSTAAPLLEALGDADRHPKTSFSCLGDERARAAIEATGRTQWLVVGMETHICVLQSVRDLRAQGHAVHVMADGCLSRTRIDYEVGLERMRGLGAHMSTVELALFDLLGNADGDTFKTVSRLIR